MVDFKTGDVLWERKLTEGLGKSGGRNSNGRVTARAVRVEESELGARIAVVFDRVSLAFDDHVVLNDLSFEIPRGSMRILLGPSGSIHQLPCMTDSG